MLSSIVINIISNKAVGIPLNINSVIVGDLHAFLSNIFAESSKLVWDCSHHLAAMAWP